MIGGKLHKVTVDEPKQPFSRDLVSSMAKQAGVTKKQFYAALDAAGHPAEQPAS